MWVLVTYHTQIDVQRMLFVLSCRTLFQLFIPVIPCHIYPVFIVSIALLLWIDPIAGFLVLFACHSYLLLLYIAYPTATAVHDIYTWLNTVVQHIRISCVVYEEH
jgi:hypothetical protein